MVTADHSAVNSAQPSATSNPEFRKSSIPSSSMSRKKVDGGNPRTNPQGTQPVPNPQYSSQSSDQLTGTSCSQQGGVGKGWLDIASHPLSQAGIPTASKSKDNLPTVDRAKPSIIVAKSSTGPTVSKHNTLPSPQSSVDTRTYDRLPDLAQLLAETAVSEDRLNSSYGIIDIEGDTDNEVGTLNLETLTSSPCPSLIEPRGRSDAMFIAGGNKRKGWRKSHQKSLDTELSDHVTSGVPSASGIKDPVSRKHLGDMLALPSLSRPQEARERSTTHSSLDRHPENRVQHRSSPSEPQSPPQMSQVQAGQVSAQSPIRANIDGSWSCTYCTNIVFDESVLCDVCGHHNPDGGTQV